MLLCVSNYDFPEKDDEVQKAANEFFDKQVTKEVIAVNQLRELSAEDKQKKKDAIKADGEKARPTITKNYVDQLKTKKSNRLNDLPGCVDDTITSLAYLIKDVGCPSHEITILATEKDFDAILKGATERILNVKPEQDQQWKDFPQGSRQTGAPAVNENLLVPAKAQYSLLHRYLDTQEIEEGKALQCQRLDPTEASLNEFCENLKVASKEKGAKVMSMWFIAGHGFMFGGKQIVVNNKFDKNSNYYERLRIEDKVRKLAPACPNLYIVVALACCRSLGNP